MTTYKKTAKYNFEKNLLALSKSKDLVEATSEWYEFAVERRQRENYEVCICQHTVWATLIFLYNETTQNAIVVGVGCFKKFGIKNEKKLNINIKELLNEASNMCEYEKIDDPVEYANRIRKNIIQNIKKRCDERENIETLTKLKEEVKSYVETHNMQFLLDVYNEIVNKLENLLENQRKRRMEVEQRWKIQQQITLKEIESKKDKVIKSSDGLFIGVYVSTFNPPILFGEPTVTT